MGSATRVDLLQNIYIFILVLEGKKIFFLGKKWDSNPRLVTPTPVFKTGALNHSAIFPVQYWRPNRKAYKSKGNGVASKEPPEGWSQLQRGEYHKGVYPFVSSRGTALCPAPRYLLGGKV